ncbi:hypothetical protein GN956_G4170 [Arapaima gigas]
MQHKLHSRTVGCCDISCVGGESCGSLDDLLKLCSCSPGCWGPSALEAQDGQWDQRGADSSLSFTHINFHFNTLCSKENVKSGEFSHQLPVPQVCAGEILLAPPPPLRLFSALTGSQVLVRFCGCVRSRCSRHHRRDE